MEEQMTDYILIEKIWQDIFCYQVKITCASSHVVATMIYIYQMIALIHYLMA